MPFKIIHIHTDLKFIDESAIFEGPDFENEVIILGDSGGYNGRYKKTATYLNPARSNINQLINLCGDVDMVVLYNLCFLKSFITNRLPQHVKIAWRFFGHELYRYDLAEQQSDLTKAMLAPDKFSFLDGLKNLKNRIPALRSVRNLFEFRAVYDVEFRKAIKRMDLFLWHFQEEYEYLKKQWPELPPFVNLPTLNLPTLNYGLRTREQFEKENLIILGHSRNSLNNHFDILSIVLQSNNYGRYVFNLPFSYDRETNYTTRLREEVKDHKNIVLSEAFLSLDDYEAIFERASALVINTYRQKALGSILLALKNGVKVYLNRRNISLSILTSQGLRVFSVDQFNEDLENKNTRLSKEDVVNNTSILNKLKEAHLTPIFQKTINDLLIKSYCEVRDNSEKIGFILPKTKRGEKLHRKQKRFWEIELIIKEITDFIKRNPDYDSRMYSILEFGSGPGFQTPFLKPLGNIVASDVFISEELKRDQDIKFVECSIDQAPFKNEQFDLIFSNHVIEHIENIENTFRELQRIGNSSCVYAFSVPTNLWLLLSVPGQYYKKVRNVVIKMKNLLMKADNDPNNMKNLYKRKPAEANISHMNLTHYTRLLLPKGHGVEDNFIKCYFSFRIMDWEKLFVKNGFLIIATKPLLLYGPSEWPVIPILRSNSRYCSSVLFLLKKVN
jgi:SAM-dependent methyltransferase